MNADCRRLLFTGEIKVSALAYSLPRRTFLFPSIEAGLAKGVKATVVDSFGIGTTIDRILEAYLVFFTKCRTFAALADTSRRPRIDIVLDILHCKVVFVVHPYKASWSQGVSTINGFN